MVMINTFIPINNSKYSISDKDKTGQWDNKDIYLNVMGFDSHLLDLSEEHIPQSFSR